MWAARENARSIGPSSSFNGLYRRIVNLPSSIIGSVSRAMSLMGGGGGRRDQHMFHHHDQDHDSTVMIEHSHYRQQEEELAFLRSFQQQYGIAHPFFYACPFAQALKMAEEDSRFVFIYLHSPDHPYTAAFCRNTLCSEVVVQFLDANFISWAAMADRGEGLQLAALLKAASFPFCAIVAPASGSNMAVLQQVEGPVSPAELVEILQRITEEQGLAFKTASRDRDRDRDMMKANRQLREEQDAAYFAALHLDKEKDRVRRESAMSEPQQKQKQKQQLQANHEKPNKNPPPLTKTKQSGGGGGNMKETDKETQKPTTLGKDRRQSGLTHTQIQIRFPNGERREQSFLPTDKIESIYRYIDSLDLPGIGSYRLISNFPRKVYGFEQIGMTLKEAGLHPRASFFLELVE